MCLLCPKTTGVSIVSLRHLELLYPQNRKIPFHISASALAPNEVLMLVLYFLLQLSYCL